MQSAFRFGTVGAPLSTPKKPGGSVGALQQCYVLEMGAFELGWVQSVRVSEETCHAIKQAGLDNDVHISVHAPYFINLNGDEDEWPKSRKRLMDAAYYGYLAGATDIIFHPGSYFGKAREEVLPIAIGRLGECAAELRAAGTNVILRPETMGKPAMLGSLEDTLEMSSQVPGVAPCLDFAHLHARIGDGTMNSYAEWISVIDAYAYALGQESLKSLHIHLSGIEYSAKGERKHLPIQESDFLCVDLFRALLDRGCAGRILCESPAMEEDAAYMAKVWKELAV